MALKAPHIRGSQYHAAPKPPQRASNTSGKRRMHVLFVALIVFVVLARNLLVYPMPDAEKVLLSSGQAHEEGKSRSRFLLSGQTAESNQFHDEGGHGAQEGGHEDSPALDKSGGNNGLEWYHAYVSPGIASKAPALKYPVWWAAPFMSGSGYSSEAVDFALGALEGGLIRPQDFWISHSGDGIDEHREANVQPHVWQFLKNQDWDNIQKVLTKEERDRPAIVVCHSFPDCWKRRGEWMYPGIAGVPCPLANMKGRYTYLIGRSMFETELLPAHLVLHAQEMDEVWVPSEFSRASFERSGVNASKIRILPQAINTTIFDPTMHEALSLADLNGTELATGMQTKHPGKPYIFLSIFKWESRKGWDILLKAFVQEFTGKEHVELHILTHPFMETVDSWKARIQKALVETCGMDEATDFDQLPRIYISTGYISEEEYPRIYLAADALVIPTHGEGWGRPQMEAMAMGLPVISTNWSGLTAFLNEKTGYPIPIEAELVQPKKDGKSFFPWFEGASWAQPNLTELQRIMRHVFTNVKEAKAVGAAGRALVLANFTPHAVGLKLQQLVLDAQKAVEERSAATDMSSDEEEDLYDGSSMLERYKKAMDKEGLTAEDVRGFVDYEERYFDNFGGHSEQELMDEFSQYGEKHEHEMDKADLWDRGEHAKGPLSDDDPSRWKTWSGYNVGTFEDADM